VAFEGECLFDFNILRTKDCTRNSITRMNQRRSNKEVKSNVGEKEILSNEVN
jgi:hypothetical protein